jgi:protein-S-isoprenylcysteine O-methyltransferase Ste14
VNDKALLLCVVSMLGLLVWRYWLARQGAIRPWASIAVWGLVLTAAGARRLRPLELAGIEQARHQPRHPRDEHLVLAWPYSLVRHPIYLGWVLVVFGVPHMTASRLLLAILSTAYLVAAVPLEERQLERVFGEGYRHYRQRVRWRILPGVY